MPKVRITAVIFAVLAIVSLLLGAFSKEWRYRFSKRTETGTTLEYREGWGLSGATVCIKCLLGCNQILGERRACETITYKKHVKSLEIRYDRLRKYFWEDSPDMKRLKKEIKTFDKIRIFGPVLKYTTLAGVLLAVFFIILAYLHKKKFPRLIPIISGFFFTFVLLTGAVIFIIWTKTHHAPKVTFSAFIHIFGSIFLSVSAVCLYIKPTDPFASVMDQLKD